MAEEVTSPEKLPNIPPVLPDDEVLYELADLFRVFGDSTRIKILYAPTTTSFACRTSQTPSSSASRR